MKYASIQDSIILEVATELAELRPATVAQGHWVINEGKLQVELKGELYDFEFERGDATSESIVLILNHLNTLIDVLRRRTHESPNRDPS
jgi:hypothetical protein